MAESHQLLCRFLVTGICQKQPFIGSASLLEFSILKCLPSERTL
jgi:hypothetical protein